MDPRIQEMVDEVSAANLKSRVDLLSRFGTRNTFSPVPSDRRGIDAARRFLQAEFELFASEGRLTLHVDPFRAEANGRTADVANVAARLPGCQVQAAERAYVIGAHYDSRNADRYDGERDAPGANDDASGCAVVLELARILSRRELESSVVFVLFAGEEQGLLGSRHWVAEARRKGIFVDAMLNNDIVGNVQGGNGATDAAGVRLFSEGGDADGESPSRQLARYAREVAKIYVPGFDVRLVFRKDRLGRGGDHLPFHEAGYPSVRFTEALEDYSRQHQDMKEWQGRPYGDLPEWVDSEYLAKVAKVNLATIASLALAPAPPREVDLRGARSHVTKLAWMGGTEPDLAGYEVLVRATTAPEWERTIEVGKATEYAIAGLAPDDSWFAVRSVDQHGHRSRAVIAVPKLE